MMITIMMGMMMTTMTESSTWDAREWLLWLATQPQRTSTKPRMSPTIVISSDPDYIQVSNDTSTTIVIVIVISSDPIYTLVGFKLSVKQNNQKPVSGSQI